MLFGTKPKQIGGLLGMMAAPQQTSMQQAPLLGALGQPDRMAMFEQPQQQIGDQPDPRRFMMNNAQAGMERYQQPHQAKGPGINWLGVLADGLAGAAGQTPLYAQRMMQERQDARRQQMAAEQAQLERQQGMEDWQAKEMWKRQNPEPHYNDTQADLEYYKSLSPQDQAIYDRLHPITVMGPDGPYAVPRSALGQTAPQASVGQSDWDSATPVGGGSGNATGGFPKVTGNKLDRVTVQAESAGNPHAVSPKGARGLWQVMPATARDPGFGIRPSNGTPQDDARVGQEYRRAMETRYGGNLPLMWGAYNWGPGNVDKARAKWGDRWLDHAPAETRNYVARNMRAVRGN